MPGWQGLERPERKTAGASHQSQSRGQRSMCPWCSTWSECGCASACVSARSSWTSQQVSELAREPGMSLKTRSGGSWLLGTKGLLNSCCRDHRSWGSQGARPSCVCICARESAPAAGVGLRPWGLMSQVPAAGEGEGPGSSWRDHVSEPSCQGEPHYTYVCICSHQ